MHWLNSVLLLSLSWATADCSDASSGNSPLGTLNWKPLSLKPGPPQTRQYTFEITRQNRNADGVTRELLLVNGQFPGPTIEANVEDTLSITVINKIDGPKEGTNIHWHGIPQKDTKWADGVPSVTQCPIAYGHNLTYTFKPEVAGTTWWHAHFSAQYTDGLFGPLIIHGSKYAEGYDIDLGPVLLHDTYHVDYVSYLLPVYNIPPIFIPSDNNLINGRMPFDCSLDDKNSVCTPNSTGFSKFRFQHGKKHLLRLINAGGGLLQHFSIDGHELNVIAVDFAPVKAYKTKVLTIGAGQRYDVIVDASLKPDAYWMRADADVFCFNATMLQPNGTAAIYYEGADETKLPTTQKHEWEQTPCVNDPLDITEPIEKKTPPTPDLTKDVQISAHPNGTGHLLFYVDDTTFRANFTDTPLLLSASNGVTDFSAHPEYNIHTYDAKHIRLVLYNTFPTAHTMHLHGHADFWILDEGMGQWNGKIVQPSNPIRRDSAQMRMGWPENPSYLVIQFEADNPGVWSLHCHLTIHVSAGLYMSIIEQPTELAKQKGKYDDIMAKTCEPWHEFIETNPPLQFDSGLRLMHRDKIERSLTEIKKLAARSGL